MRWVVAILVVCSVLVVACDEEELISTDGADPATSERASDGASATRTINPEDILTPVVSPSVAASMSPTAQSALPITTEGSLHLDHSFEDLEDLTTSAEVVVVATVTGTEQRPFGGLPFTASTLAVEDVLKGELRVGDAVSVIETGGDFTARDKDGSGGGQPIETTFAGVPPMKTGETWLLFLGTAESGDLARGARSVLNGFQGKFKIGEDDLIHFTGAPETLDEPYFTLPAANRGRPAAEMIGEVRDISSR